MNAQINRTYWLNHPRDFQNEYTVAIATAAGDATQYAAKSDGEHRARDRSAFINEFSQHVVDLSRRRRRNAVPAQRQADILFLVVVMDVVAIDRRRVAQLVGSSFQPTFRADVGGVMSHHSCFPIARIFSLSPCATPLTVNSVFRRPAA
jgi:hypothetical protein